MRRGVQVLVKRTRHKNVTVDAPHRGLACNYRRTEASCGQRSSPIVRTPRSPQYHHGTLHSPTPSLLTLSTPGPRGSGDPAHGPLVCRQNWWLPAPSVLERMAHASWFCSCVRIGPSVTRTVIEKAAAAAQCSGPEQQKSPV